MGWKKPDADATLPRRDEAPLDARRKRRRTDGRIDKARRMLASGRMTLIETSPAGRVLAVTKSPEGPDRITYRVAGTLDEWRCNCVGFADRAICSHVVALRLLIYELPEW